MKNKKHSITKVVLFWFVFFSVIITALTLAYFRKNNYVDNLLFEIQKYQVVIVGIAAVISFYHRSRLQTHVKNRMDWINNIRDELSQFFEYIDKKIHGAGRQAGTKFRITSRIELFLNPSEKDHRALLTLMRLLDHPASVAVDCEVLERLCIFEITSDCCRDTLMNPERHIYVYCPVCYSRLKRFFKITPVETSGANCNSMIPGEEFNEQDLISMVFRLAQAILKREWERVKSVT